MRERRGFVDRVLDVAVFGPLGFALEARRLVPELASRGREHVEAQLEILRGVGRFAARLGRQAVVPSTAGDRGVTGTPDPTTVTTVTAVTDGEVPVRIVDELETARNADEAQLPIDGYDALAASQIVARLDGLAPRQLRQVEMYERAHRGRRTILHRVAQLLHR
jgi:hypothetical protein